MRVVVLHSWVSPDAAPEEHDVLVQVDRVTEALHELGHAAVQVPATRNLQEVRDELTRQKPDVVFNLVESLGGSDQWMHLAPELLDSIGVPYTGAPTSAMRLTTHKLLTKPLLQHAELPTPAWLRSGSEPAVDDEPPSSAADLGSLDFPAAYIIKAVCEHASFGLDDAALMTASDRLDLETKLRQRTAKLGRPCFAERYVEGREFNVSLLTGPGGPEVLPIAEIDFDKFPPEQPRILGYRAKWDEASFEFQNTPRRFDLARADERISMALGELALACWRLFGLEGYARVDFRLDGRGKPWILEINTNPCLSPDAGFAAALAEASVSFPQAVERILDAAWLVSTRPCGALPPARAALL